MQKERLIVNTSRQNFWRVSLPIVMTDPVLLNFLRLSSLKPGYNGVPHVDRGVSETQRTLTHTFRGLQPQRQSTHDAEDARPAHYGACQTCSADRSASD